MGMLRVCAYENGHCRAGLWIGNANLQFIQLAALVSQLRDDEVLVYVRGRYSRRVAKTEMLDVCSPSAHEPGN